MKKAIIIGAGIGGIATGIRLAIKGYDVHIFEANSEPGGKLVEFSANGYRFDFGPSLFTLPILVDELFKLAGKDPKAYFNYSRLDTSCNYFYEDGTQLTAFSDETKFGKEVEDKLGVPPEVLKNYLNHSKLIFEATKPVFLEKSLHKFSSFLNADTLRALSKAHQFDLFETMHDATTKRVVEPRLVQLFDRYATYNGSNPYKAPGILNLIPALEHLDGSYFPEGGMYSITRALVTLAEELGVKFHFNSKVDEILHKNSFAYGIRSLLKTYEADIIVSNMDVYLTYRHLLKNYKVPEKTLRQERSSSALVFYWGINRSFEQLNLHNIFFSADYKKEFEMLFEEKQIIDDPTVYINITSKLNPSDAPKGQENWFVMVNAPAIEKQSWSLLIEETKRNVLSKLSRMLHTNIADCIDYEFITDPLLIESKTQSHKGSLYGTSSNSKFAAFLRHPNFNRKIKNLYFCGGSVHPGGGIPLCLMSAKIVDSLV